MNRSAIISISSILLLQVACTKNPTPTTPDQPTPPTVQTLPVTGIGNASATSGFEVTKTDTTTIVERGIVWDTTAMPTIGLPTRAFINADSSTHSLQMTNLKCVTAYFVRAYITTASGSVIYGNEIKFTTGEIANADRQLILSKTTFTDTVITQFYVDKFYPKGGASFLNRLSLPPGVFLYVKFDSANNLSCTNGITSKLCNTGDTMNFGPLNPRGFVSQSAITVFPAFLDDPYDKSSAGKFSIHVAGTAMTSDTTYRCKFYDDGYGPTTSTHQSIYFADTSACISSCKFQ